MATNVNVIKENFDMKIKRCPFCGGDGEIKSNNISPFIIDSFFVRCEKCNADGPPVKTNKNLGKKDAIKLWNKRL